MSKAQAGYCTVCKKTYKNLQNHLFNFQNTPNDHSRATRMRGWRVTKAKLRELARDWKLTKRELNLPEWSMLAEQKITLTKGNCD